MPFSLSRSYFDTTPARSSRRAGRASGKKSGSGSTKAKAMARVQSAAIIGGTAYALGQVEGRYGMYVFSKDYKWLSADLVGALAVHIASFYGAIPASVDKYAVDAANGALAYWAGFLGSQHGNGAAYPAVTKNKDPNASIRGGYELNAHGQRVAMTPEQLWQSQQYRG